MRSVLKKEGKKAPLKKFTIQGNQKEGKKFDICLHGSIDKKNGFFTDEATYSFAEVHNYIFMSLLWPRPSLFKAWTSKNVTGESSQTLTRVLLDGIQFSRFPRQPRIF